MNNLQNSIFGTFYTRKFTDVFPGVATFIDAYRTNGIQTTISEENARTLYYLLYSRFGNSSFSNFDENQAKYKIWATIFQYGPAWEKRLSIQSTLRGLSEAELITGSKSITNRAYNPSQAPSTNTLEEISTINEQSTNTFKKSKLDAYNLLINLIESDVTNEFLSKFQKIFISIVAPQGPLLYGTDLEEEE